MEFITSVYKRPRPRVTLTLCIHARRLNGLECSTQLFIYLEVNCKILAAEESIKKTCLRRDWAYCLRLHQSEHKDCRVLRINITHDRVSTCPVGFHNQYTPYWKRLGHKIYEIHRRNITALSSWYAHIGII
jgi:hypothetical protein